MSSRRSFNFGDIDSSDDESGQTGSQHKGLYHSPIEGYGNFYFGSEKGKMNSTSSTSHMRPDDILDQDSESEEEE